MNQIKRNVSKWGNAQDAADAGAGTEHVSSAAQVKPAKAPATIGASIRFKGDLSGEEDFVIQGRVDGTIHLKKNNLTIGVNGKVHADITASTITVEGELRGDLLGSEKVVIRKTGNVLGNIVSPRVTLEDGAKFKGSIEMDPAPADAAPASRGGSLERPAPGGEASPGKSDLKRA
ncbi:MAG: polymer-forming cytoskeletal protein [Pseudomonadota bacterium]|nr:MAG: polymer-forming cytoskeletal protein [Pseudomonadota bacterium]